MSKTVKKGSYEDYIKIQKKLSRELELEKNGGRWISIDRPWKNKKKYDRKRDGKVDFSSFFMLIIKPSYYSKKMGQ